ncbi:hypothetical protein FE257_001217 [Aspergillus nanangensis]|uniref:LITAF domain-containing protein n=1 Tax=Aspergillus nanangensis TaxID=2582783 RepID=A0AAD4GPT9_ASPNN|nr:hypothetical protein FE257_001217 [Aspergillus nanangensis]
MEKVNSTPVPFEQPKNYYANPPTPIQPDIAYVHDPIHTGPQVMAPPQQQWQPGMPHPSGYNMASPLHALQRGPSPVDCPVCAHREMTRVEAEAGNTTHGWAAVLCCCFCLGCIPYLMSSLKDIHHHCGKCGVLLATWHGSGRTEVHQNLRN